MPESLADERRAPFRWSRANPIGAVGLLISKAGLLGMAAIYFLAQLSNQTFSVFQFYTHFRYGWGPFQVGLLLMVLGGGGILIQGFGRRRGEPLAGRARRGAGRRTSLALVAFVVAGYAPTQLWFWASMMIFILAGDRLPEPLPRCYPSASASTSRASFRARWLILFGVTGLIGPLFFSNIFAWSIGAGGWLHLPGFRCWSAPSSPWSRAFAHGLPLCAARAEGGGRSPPSLRPKSPLTKGH